MGFISNVQRIAAGRTPPGTTDWQVYLANSIYNGIYLDVDTSAAHFTGTPVYVTSIGGNSSHWSTTGATSIYNPSATSFRVYVRWVDGSPLTPATANANGWHINWIGTEI
jgi:hypothetical protein